MRKKTGAAPVVYPSAIVAKGAVLGRDTMIGAHCFVAEGARIGAGTRVQSHSAIWKGVVLEDDVFVGPSATFTNVRHPRADFVRAPHFDETIVERGATLGAGCVLVAPVRVGTRAVVAAGAVVTRDVSPHAIVAGAPARVIGWACTCGETLTHVRSAPRAATCRVCGRTFARSARALAEVDTRSKRQATRTQTSTRRRKGNVDGPS